MSHPFPSVTSHFPFIPATNLPQGILATHRRQECESFWTSASIRERRLRTSSAAPHVPPVKVDQNPDETATEPVAMINWRANLLMKYLGATLDPISDPDVEASWSAEIERRLAEIDSGTVDLIPWDDVRLELFGKSEWRE